MSIIQLIESKILDSSFDKTPIIIISGPTGVGKSNLALSLAKKINEIYSENPNINCLILMNHGIFTFGDDNT